ncbi:hypothetical protein [Streptomyces crystallinus]|uniref:Uncharacterized protein n=1 Tax=Streptomyces crystallinus TaxID=68191 RepID=A0ABN1GLE8_9ACTN
MTDTITVRLDVRGQGLPEINYRNKRIVTPETITFVYLIDNPGPVNGIYPACAEVTGRCRSARGSTQGPRRTTECFYRAWPDFWPAWLITFGAEHRPR